jgi:hypothetical protein
MTRLTIVLALGAGLVACSNDGGGGSARDAVIAAWKKAGLTPSAMTADKTGAIGEDCVSGTVSGVDVVLCTFKKPDDATAAVAKGYTWVGGTTGTSLAKDKLLLAAADRNKADPTGRTLNSIAKTFRGK